MKGSAKKIKTIKKNTDFQLVFEKGHSMNGRYLVVYFLHNRLDCNRFGFCVGRKLGPAVRRNRVKRLFREAVREVLSLGHSGWDIVLVARTPSVTAQYQNILEEYKQILIKSGILNKMKNTNICHSNTASEGKDF